MNDGYARNFILPKKLGIEATSKNLNDLKLQKANADKIAAEQLQAAKDLAADLAEKSITLSIKAGEGGKAFGSVSSVSYTHLDVYKRQYRDIEKEFPKYLYHTYI